MKTDRGGSGNGDGTGDIPAKEVGHIVAGRMRMIRKLKSGEFRIYSRHQDPKTGRRKNLGTFSTRKKAQEHEKAIQYFKRH
jgi:hypothetical protein